MKTPALITGGVVIIVAIILLVLYAPAVKAPVANTCEAGTQLCPDGSSVSRTGPQCAFECPPVDSGLPPYTSGVLGKVSIGPICPVMKNPPNAACADAPYATIITIYKAGSNSVFTTTVSTTTGAFKVDLPAGSYVIKAGNNKSLPRCATITAIVVPHTYATTTISCDTGIR